MKMRVPVKNMSVRGMKKHAPFHLSKSGLLCASVAAIVLAQVEPVQAAEDIVLEEVLVESTYRKSLERARDLKRAAIGSQDSIVAEDIADFPDLNLADSLQRVPGVAITREGGEGRQISLRGLGPDFTRVQLNGMEALATSASAMDSRGAISRSRAFDFNVFASELFNQIDVKKSYQASLDEGGIGGTVNLRTAKPFDFDGLTSVVSLQMGDNTQTDSRDPRIAAIVSNTWDTFGALFSASYSMRDTNEQGYNGYRWRKRTRTNSGEDPQYSESLSQEVKTALEGGQIFFMRGNRYTVWENEQERLGLTSALQFRPTDNLSFDLDVLYSKLSNNRNEWHLPTAGSSSTALGFINDLEIQPAADGDGYEAVYGNFSNVSLRTESREDEDITRFTQITLASTWDVTDDLVVKATLGHAKSDFKQPQRDKYYIETIGGLTTDFRGSNRFYGVNTYTFDPADTSVWNFKELDAQEEEILNEFDNLQVVTEYTIDDTSMLRAGVARKTFENIGSRRARNDVGRDTKPAPLNQTVRTVDQLAFVFTGHDKFDWIGADVNEAFAFYGVNPDLGEEYNVDSSDYKVKEETSSAFVEYEWEQDFISNTTLRGNIGLRYYATDITSSGVSSGVAVNLERDYSGVLPTLNLAWELSEDVVLRGSASKNLTRPSLGELSVSGNVNNDPNGSTGLQVSAGNPALEPFESMNYDASLEWYFSDTGAVALGMFYKDIDNFIADESATVPYSETGFPLSLLGVGQTGSTPYLYKRPMNGSSTDIKGVELSFQSDLTFLPEPFNRLGVVANYTFSDGEFLFENVQGQAGLNQVKNFPGLSEHSANFTLYYETDVWGARVSSAYRSDYLTDGNGTGGDEDERGFHATTNVDLSAFYQLNDNLKLTFEGLNLTDVAEEQYSDTADRLYNTTTSGTTYYLGVSYKF